MIYMIYMIYMIHMIYIICVRNTKLPHTQIFSS